MNIGWKKTTLILLDVTFAIYIVLAFTSFNKPNDAIAICSKVNILITDQTPNGFLNAKEIKDRLVNKDLYPLEKPLKYVNTRDIEEMLMNSAFVKTAQCYKTQDGQIYIYLTQRMPVVRVKSINNDDYYIDDHNQVMPNTKYTSDIIISTGYINRWYAQRYISILSKTLMNNDLWKNQIEQINILPDRSIELVPRVGNHIIRIGKLPESNYQDQREKEVSAFVEKQMNRLESFYKYGLSQAGWNKYDYINLEFSNQIICKKHVNNEQ
nr:cell division protein FtsQ [Prevotella sp.]